MLNHSPTIDPITLEVLWNRLISVVNDEDLLDHGGSFRRSARPGREGRTPGLHGRTQRSRSIVLDAGTAPTGGGSDGGIDG